MVSSLRVIATILLWGMFLYGVSFVLPSFGIGIGGGVKVTETEMIGVQIQIMKHVKQPQLDLRKPVM